MPLDKHILLNILALDKAFEDFEFIHSYLGSSYLKHKAVRIPVEEASETLKESLTQLDDFFPDEFPFYRRTYVRDLICSVLAQVDYFINKKEEGDFQNFIETLYSIKTLPVFDLPSAYCEFRQALKALGFKSYQHFQSKRRVVCFKDKKELKGFVMRILKMQKENVSREYGVCLGVDVKKILNRSQVKILFAGPNDPSCFYVYKGQYCGEVGFSMKPYYNYDYLQNFIYHEVLPGHHLYYLIKEQLLQQKKTDCLLGLDTFYSPENLINEGLAVNSDLLMHKNWDCYSLTLLTLDKFMHKVYHNAWYAVNIRNESVPEDIVKLLHQEFGLSEQQIRDRLHYFTHEARYYTPSYALGISQVSDFIREKGAVMIPFLYGQHSLNTLKKLGAHYEQQH